MKGIYKISTNIDDKVYIGQSINIFSRWSQHEAGLKNNCHTSYKLQDIYNKNKHNIKLSFEILEEVKENRKLNERELYWINKYNSLENGLNVADVILYKNQKKNPIKIKKVDTEAINISITGMGEKIDSYKNKNLKKLYDFVKDNNIILVVKEEIDELLINESELFYNELKLAFDYFYKNDNEYINFIKKNVGILIEK